MKLVVHVTVGPTVDGILWSLFWCQRRSFVNITLSLVGGAYCTASYKLLDQLTNSWCMFVIENVIKSPKL